MHHPSKLDMVPVGIIKGQVLHVSSSALAQKGVREQVEYYFQLTERFPVQTNLSGHTVMVEAESQEEAIQKYLSRKLK